MKIQEGQSSGHPKLDEQTERQAGEWPVRWPMRISSAEWMVVIDGEGEGECEGQGQCQSTMYKVGRGSQV